MDVVVKKFNALWDRMVYYMGFSFLGRIILAFVAGCSKAAKNSFFVRLLSSPTFYEAAEGSVIKCFIGWIFGLFTRVGNGVGGRMAQNSFILRTVGNLVDQWIYLSCSRVGSFLLGASFGLIFVLRLGWISIVFPVVGILLMLLPVSCYGLVAGSWVFRFLTGIKEERNFSAKAGLDLPGFLLGILASLLMVAAGAKVAILVLGAIIGGALLLARPEIGIYGCVFLAPFLPTMVLAALLGATLVCFVLQLMGGGKYTFRMDTTGVFLVAFAGILIFFGLTSYDRASSIKIALLECLFLTAYFLILFMVDSKVKIKTLVFTYCTSALFTGFVGLMQYLSGNVDTTWTDTDLFEGLSLRVYSTFENPNVFGEYLLLCIPMAVIMMCITKRWVGKLYYAGISGVLLVNLALTYSRGCYLGILLAAAIVIWFGARKLIAFGFVGLFALPFVLPQSIIQRFASITNLADSSTSYRINIWQGTVRMLEDFWPFGVGLGQQAYNVVYPIYGLNAVFAPHAHSLYLQVLSEMGIAGFAILIGFCLSFFATAYVAMKKAKGSRTMWFIIAMMGAVGAFLFEGIFEYIWYNYRVFLLFFITLGIVMALCRDVIREGELAFD